MSELINKYNYEVPRYTSYPVITNWKDNLDTAGWQALVKGIDVEQQKLSIYIHLPFCESLCTYCGCNKHITTNHDVEEPYLALLQKEGELYSQLFDGKPKLSELHLGGGTPTFFSAHHLAKFLSKMLAGFDTGVNPSYSFEAHPASTKADHLTALFELGFRRLSIGVQDFNANILRTINRFQTTSQVYDTVELARNAGYTSINFDLIYGLPGQKLSDIETSMGHVATLKPERIAFYSYAHVPWTKPSQRAYNEDDLPQGAEKRQLYEYGKELLESLGYTEIGMDHFALHTDELYIAREENRMNRNFMGYTDLPSDTMIGIGVSSISELLNGYHQNVKTLKEYTAMINDGKIPTLRAHRLSDTEMRTRQHIKNLMCHLNTPVDVLQFLDTELLDEMLGEGLIEKTETHWQILPTGLPFIRNISAAFDPQFQRAQNQKRFSGAI